MWRWLVAGLLGITAMAVAYGDPSGRFSFVIALVFVAAAMGVRVLVERQVPEARTWAEMRVHLLLTGFVATVLILLALRHPLDAAVGWPQNMLPVVLIGAVLALAVSFVVGGATRIPGRSTWALYTGYGLAAWMSGAIVNNLFDQGGEFVFPMGAMILIIYGGPGAALGGLLGWMIRAASDRITVR